MGQSMRVSVEKPGSGCKLYTPVLTLYILTYPCTFTGSIEYYEKEIYICCGHWADAGGGACGDSAV